MGKQLATRKMETHAVQHAAFSIIHWCQIFEADDALFFLWFLLPLPRTVVCIRARLPAITLFVSAIWCKRDYEMK